MVQVRLRFCQPRPQLVLQPDHCVHVDQPPFTGWRGTHQRLAGMGDTGKDRTGGQHRGSMAGTGVVEPYHRQ